MSQPPNKGPDNPAILYMRQIASKAETHDELYGHLKTETANIEQSVRSALLIMRAMYAQLMALDPRDYSADEWKELKEELGNLEDKRHFQSVEIQALESRLESFKSAVDTVDKETVSRKINPEVVEGKIDDIKSTLDILDQLKPPEQSQNIFNMTPAGKYRILSNMLGEAVEIAHKYLYKLEDKTINKITPSNPPKPG